MLKLRSTGRGKRYSVLRGAMEAVQRALYFRSWPSRLLAFNPLARHVAPVRHSLPLLRRDGPPLRIAFVSDLHIGPLTPPPLLDAAFATLQAERPDVLALGGDYVSYEATPEKAARLEELVRRVPAAVKVAVLGNHDLWTRHHHLEEALARAGVTLLVNRSLRLPAPHDDVAFVGLDDPWAGEPDADAAFAGVEAPVRVLLCHAPDFLRSFGAHAAHLALCGHTHGGQIALPDRPLIVPGRFSRRYHAGLHDVGAMKLFVSRGIGFSDLPLRTFAPPDVALVTLEHRAAPRS